MLSRIGGLLEGKTFSKEELSDFQNKILALKFIVREDDPVPGELFLAEMGKADKRKQRLDNCMAATIEVTGWDVKMAKQHIKETRARCGITFKDYVKLEFWNVPVE